MSYIIYLFFKHYSKGATKLVPYQKSVFVFLFILFINFFSIGILISPNIFRGIHFPSKIQSYIFFTMFFVIGYFIVNKLVPEKTIREYKTNSNTKIHSWLLLFYVLASIILMLISLIRSRHE